MMPREGFCMSTGTSTGSISSPPSLPASQISSDRLMSLDALRGFDMFIITGGKYFLIGLATLFAGKKWLITEEGVTRLTKELTHPEWSGFTFYDLIFPLFIFLVGVALPFSLSKRIERGDSKRQLYAKIFRRTVLLVLLGMICTNKLLLFDFSDLRYVSVLEKIGVAYFFAAIITLHTSARGRIAWIVAILVGYWAALMFIPAPGVVPGKFDLPGATLTDYLDRLVTPGRLIHGDRDPEGLISTIAAVATALFGVLAGQWLRESQRSGLQKALALLIAGLGCLALGGVWDHWLPINKNLWTSSFTLWCAGWSLLLMGIFYLVIDVWGWRKWAFFFVVIGMNAITIYAMKEFGIDFDALGKLIFGRAPIAKEVVAPLGIIAVEWLLLYVLYRSRTFLRV
jgi:predicted acyltransferase